MKKILAIAVTTTALFSTSTLPPPDIKRAYKNERKYIEKVIDAVELAIEKQKEIVKVTEAGNENQSLNQASRMTMQSKNDLLQQQMSVYTQMEIQRADSVILQTKQILQENMRLNSQISREDIAHIIDEMTILK